MTTSTLAIQPTQTAFTQQQVATLRQIGIEKANEGDLAVFFHHCVRTGLDPFAKQIYMVGRWDGRAGREKFTIQTGIDGYRLIAERTGAYAGSEEAWEYDATGKLQSATVTVRKVVSGVVCTFAATAHWDEYVQTTKDGRPSGMWARMPKRMLAKCAEANALRKAFPQDLSGLYTDEEMSQADQPARAEVIDITHAPHAVPQPAPAIEVATAAAPELIIQSDAPSLDEKPITAAQIKRIHAITTKIGIEDDKYRERLQSLYGVTTSKDLSFQQAADLVKRLEAAQ
jgi:phage recombination protein Bet